MKVVVKRILVLPIVALLAALGFAGSVLAAAQSTTTHEHGATETFTDVICEEGTLYEITTTYNGVDHVTSTASGFHETFTEAGTFVAIDIATGETVTGHFTIWGGYNENPGGAASGTFTFSAHGTGDAGTTVNAHSTEHFNGQPDGTVHEFFRGHCS